MRWSLRGTILLLAVALLGAPAEGRGTAPASRPRAFESARVLVERLRARGRAEAVFESSVTTLTGEPRRTRGGLALEPPDRARLEFPATGEVITLRGDGGEWLQPANHQMLRFGSENATPVLQWWALFMEGGSARFREKRIGPRAYEIAPLGTASSGDSTGASAGSDMVAHVWLGSDGLPARIELTSEGGAPTEYRLSAWRFARPRGRAGFVVEPPAGVEVVDLQ